MRNTRLALLVGIPLMIFGFSESAIDSTWTPLRWFWLSMAVVTLGVLILAGRQFFTAQPVLVRIRRWQELSKWCAGSGNTHVGHGG